MLSDLFSLRRRFSSSRTSAKPSPRRHRRKHTREICTNWVEQLERRHLLTVDFESIYLSDAISVDNRAASIIEAQVLDVDSDGDADLLIATMDLSDSTPGGIFVGVNNGNNSFTWQELTSNTFVNNSVLPLTAGNRLEVSSAGGNFFDNRLYNNWPPGAGPPVVNE